eukprot:CAMPEP_0206323072 /NCGR_PEP_ID=MMETSP0106_2-20121207/19771_1 /ASSEMBLY_ACC=CAM_ASM_000206 /TAXON_ID=81532 /ORGANISM="Acanthoeca-like sp., Strain 10tr" /LENGTH=37 /DNA_ID= /DNA_START= /DNA_END= /DNA_ORIENTATION=
MTTMRMVSSRCSHSVSSHCEKLELNVEQSEHSHFLYF